MNLLESLIKETGLNASQFSKLVGKHPNQITKNLRDGGDMKFSTFKEFALKCGINSLTIKGQNCSTTIKFK